MTTPNLVIVSRDFEADLVARMAELEPSVYAITGDGRNLWQGKEEPTGGAVRDGHTFVQFVTERRDLFNGGQSREVDLQILHRHDPRQRPAARSRVWTTYDALHLSGAFTGASGGYYWDIRALTPPQPFEPAYFALNVTLFYDG